MRRRKKMLEDLDRNIRDHLERETQDLIDRGMPPAEAHYAALRKFGNVTRLKEETREVWSMVWLEQWVQDVRFGIRVLRRSPGLTVAAVLTIALGIGLNVGIFSVLNGVALRLLPIPRAEQLVSVSQTFHGRPTRNTHGETSMFSYSEFGEYRDHNHVFTGLVAYEPFVEAMVGGGKAQQLLGTATTCNYFGVLSEFPAQGRGFVDADCAAPGGNPVAVVSDELWRGRFAGDPALVSKRIILNRTAYTIVGVARPGFTGTELVPSAFWVPITMQKALEPGEDRLADNNMSWLALLGRTRTGVTMQQVRADLALIAGRIDRLHPGRTTVLDIRPATFFSRPEERQSLIPVASVILAGFALVLLIACANVANLLLARASVRHKEIALRLSIGAGRGRLIRQLLTESLLLSLAGGVLGSLLAFWSFSKLTQFVSTHVASGMPRLEVNVAPDLYVLAYALMLTFITGIAFGLIPALQSSRLDLITALKNDGAHSGSGKKNGGLRNALVATQTTVSMILLLAAGLLLRGLQYTEIVNPGFEMKNVATMFLDLRAQGYDQSRATAFVRRLRERIAGLPGVLEVAQAECAPLSHDFSADHFTVLGSGEKIGIEYNHVSSEYFSVVGIPIVWGRSFNQIDTADTPAVVVTESTARRLWRGNDPLAKTLREGTGREYSVIGVAKDAQVAHLGELNTNYLYFPAGPEDNLRTYTLIRFTGAFAPLAKEVRRAAQSLDGDLPVNVTRLEDYLEVWRMPSRILASLREDSQRLRYCSLLSEYTEWFLMALAGERTRSAFGLLLAQITPTSCALYSGKPCAPFSLAGSSVLSCAPACQKCSPGCFSGSVHMTLQFLSAFL